MKLQATVARSVVFAAAALAGACAVSFPEFDYPVTKGTGGAGGSATTSTSSSSSTTTSSSSGGKDGQACTSPSDCANGNCLDTPGGTQVCCHTACATTGSTTCGNNGKCLDDGSACADYPSTTACGNTSCSNGQISGSLCDGMGTCVTSTATACAGGVICASNTECKASCSSDSDCQGTGVFCKSPGALGTCQPVGAAGAACTGNDQCVSALCGTSGTGTHCCKAACTPTGTTCGATDCDAAGACVFVASGVACGASCAGNTLTPSTCNGTGTCAAGTPGACPNNLICASSTACKTSCSADTDCQGSGFYCATGSCVAKKATGATCAADDQCTGGVCNGGVCSDNRSCGTAGAGLNNCGASSESCCTSLAVPASGAAGYYRTYTNSGSGPTGEADLAVVSGFRLDKYLVTVGRFRKFVTAWNGGSGYLPPAGSGKHAHLNGGNGLNATGGGYEPGWATSDNNSIQPTAANLTCDPNYATWTGSNDNRPINCVNWWESYAFCIWDGGFLPSEAEWEYVAAGGSEQREYPWGATAPGTNNQYAIYANNSGQCYFPSLGNCTNVSNIAPVGTATLGLGKWGQLDMAGDVWEWNLDYWNGSSPYANPCTDCANLTTASYRVIRGGSFSILASYLLPPFRYIFTPASRLNYVGFRCARTP